MNSRRQEKFAKLMQKDLGDIFLQKTNTLFNGNFITISNVFVSPDMGYLKVYLSFFKPDNQKELLELIQQNKKEIRHELAKKVKNQVRKVPEIEFYIDDSLDYVEKMEGIFNDIKKKDNTDNNDTNS